MYLYRILLGSTAVQTTRERDQLVTLLDACSDIQLPRELLECSVVPEGLLLPLPHSTVLYFTLSCVFVRFIYLNIILTSMYFKYDVCVRIIFLI